MNQNQEMKMRLLKEFGISDDKKTVDFCREAYKFLREEDGNRPQEGSGMPSVSPSEIQLVDLGLPSGTKWADRNVGAASPEGYGAFFSWGNTNPCYPKDKNVDWGDDEDAFKDVCSFDDDSYEKTEGHKLDGDIDEAHDAATVNLGSPWRMPTKDDFQELYDNCTWVRRTVNGVNGYMVTSKINGNVVFFPCCGYGDGAAWYDRGVGGNYWSASFFSESYAWYLSFYEGGVGPGDYSSRRYGFAVRAVQKLLSNKE